MDFDSKLILAAFAASPSPKRKKFYLDDIECDIDIVGDVPRKGKPDAVTKIANRQARQTRYKKKLVKDWTHTDCLRYFSDALKNYDGYLASTGITESESMGRIYDRLVDHLGDEMNNYVLKSYIEWWLSCYAPRQAGKPFYVAQLSPDKLIELFVKRYRGSYSTEEVMDIEDKDKDVDPSAIYDTGGLPMVIMVKGIVIGFKELLDRGEKDAILRIMTTLKSFSKEVLEEVMKKTISNAPYQNKYMIDFFTLVRPYLRLHGIPGYNKLNCRAYFEENN